MQTGPVHDVIVVGAGLGGLACARDLARAGRNVLVLDKARGVSGRAATRRFEDGVKVDHGAQFFTARGERLRRLVDGWTREGWVREWSRGFPLWEAGRVVERPAGHPRFVALPGMSALGKHLARGLTARTEATVTSLLRGRDGWRILTAGGEAFEARHVLFNLPAPQLAPLLADVQLGEAGEALDRVRFEPTWTLMLELEADLAVPWVALEVRHPVLSWVSRDHTKRGEGAPPALVVHASGEWSRAHLDLERAEVAALLLAALKEVVGKVEVKKALTHRWRFATPTVSFPEPHFFDSGLNLGWCGDWCVGGRVEGALTSGWGLANALLNGAAPQDVP